MQAMANLIKRVNDMTTPLYIFDLDETLLDGDSAMIWNEFLVEKGLVDSPDFLAEDKRLMALYAQGELDQKSHLKYLFLEVC